MAAIAAIAGGTVAIAAGTYDFIADFPRGLVVLVCVLVALTAAWFGLLRHGPSRLLGMTIAALAIGLAIGVMLSGSTWPLVIAVVAFAVGVGGARAAFRPEHELPPVAPPRRPVLFINPHSGEGAAARAGLPERAAELGIETIVLGPDQDLEQLVRGAVADGADGLAMAGGDGSQAVVAGIAAAHDLPYACIPAGTRNHFALDLGVDREDVRGALEAFVDGGERYVDLAEVNGWVFVNNVSLGVYAEAVGQDEYRESKLRTLLDTFAETLGPEGEANELRWVDSEGSDQTSTALVLISNNPYLLGPTLGSGTRPKLDTGLLGIVDFHPPTAAKEAHTARWRELSAPQLEIDASSPVPVGIDGESLVLEPPLRFKSRPRALRARIARDHPGASPSAEMPRGALSALKRLFAVALGR